MASLCEWFERTHVLTDNAQLMLLFEMKLSSSGYAADFMDLEGNGPRFGGQRMDLWIMKKGRLRDVSHVEITLVS